MRNLNCVVVAMALAAGMALGGCSNSNTPASTTASMPMQRMAVAIAPSPFADVKAAVAVIHPLGDRKVTGKVTFMQTDAGVMIVADVAGLTPGKHGFHIHEFGDCSDPKGTSAGGHYNPGHEMHGMPGAAHRHPGDMGNLEADAEGKAHLEVTLPGVTIVWDKNPLLGRSIIVHEKEDDGSQPTGNAGGRIGCGVIGVAAVK